MAVQYRGAAVQRRGCVIMSHGVARLVLLHLSFWSCAREKEGCTAEGDEIGTGERASDGWMDEAESGVTLLISRMHTSHQHAVYLCLNMGTCSSIVDHCRR